MKRLQFILLFLSFNAFVLGQHSMHSQSQTSDGSHDMTMMHEMHMQMMNDMHSQMIENMNAMHNAHMQMMNDMHLQMIGNGNMPMNTNMMQMSMDMSSRSMLDDLKGKDLEIAFLSMMIEHHKGAIEMANWILGLSTNPDITKAAEAIVAAQDPEIQQMTQWLQEWYGQGIDEHSAMMMQSEMDMMMDEMGKAENPDKAFLYQMSLHHNSAIDMAQSVLFNADHAELRELAKNIILAQTQEIFQYQEWLRN